MVSNDIDTNISSYSLSELMAIVGVQSGDPKEITTKTNKLINKFKNTNPPLSVFFKEVQSQLLQYSQGLLYNNKDENEENKIVVEAFIDLDGVSGPPYPPVFYRCYWRNQLIAEYETIAFEWSATSEYINWYAANVISSGTDVASQILALSGTPPSLNLVPLLKVTNHSPSLF